MIVILGAGVAGLAAAGFLRDLGAPFLLVEKEMEAGGLCRSLRAGRYSFDMSGHFLHVSDPGMRSLLTGLPGIAWRTVARDARVFLRGRSTPFPFQVHLRGHEPGFVRRCLSDFAAERIREAAGDARPPENLAEWLRGRFGRSMCRAFFFPYNRKLWRTPLEDMDHDWTGWSIPVPRFEDVLAGARGERRDGLGYNASFLYPRRGGMGALPRALARRAGQPLRVGDGAVRVDLARRVVATARGAELPYRALIATIPLPELAARSRGLSAGSREAAAALRWVKVLVVNLGIRNPGRAEGHWTYVPERAYPFFRVGVLSNADRGAAPRGCASLFAERSFSAAARMDVRREIGSVMAGLKAMGILTGGSRIEAQAPLVIDPAYVVFDRRRRDAVPLLRREFARRGVFLAGRYGSWDYFGIEKAMADGIRAAREAAAFHDG